MILQAKFSASGKILCVWATGTGADHAYFVQVNEELASASRCGEGSYHRVSHTLPNPLEQRLTRTNCETAHYKPTHM